MLSILLPLLMPILANAAIHIDIKAGETYSSTRVEMSGYSESLVTDVDRKTFKIRDSELIHAAFLFSGGKPDNVYIKSPTPWGDLYSKWEWREVTRIVAPKYAKILDITNSNVTVLKKHLENNSEYPFEYTGALTQEADVSVKNSWVTSGAEKVGEQVSYGVWVRSASSGKSREIFYSNWFGHEGNCSSQVPIGSELTIRPILQPGAEADVTLRATKGVVRIEVTYEVTLRGIVATNYSGKFKGHHFWGYNVNQCLEAVGRPRKLNLKEEIEIEFYFNEHVTST